MEIKRLIHILKGWLMIAKEMELSFDMLLYGVYSLRDFDVS